jgi:hypothetical protein
MPEARAAIIHERVAAIGSHRLRARDEATRTLTHDSAHARRRPADEAPHRIRSVSMIDATLLATLATAVLGGLAVPLFLMARATWKWSELDAVGRARTRRQIASSALVFMPIVGVPALIAALVVEHVLAPVVLGASIAIALAVWLDRSTRTLDTIHQLGRMLRDPAKGPKARDRIVALLEAAPPDDPIGVAVILAGTTVLSNEGFDRDALPWLEAVKVENLSAHQRELWSLGLVDALLSVGEIERARAAFAQVPALEPGSFHAYALDAMRARLLLADGKPNEALALVDEAATDREVERGRCVIRAHCHAALGRLDRCHAALEWLHANFGDEGLRRVTQPEGPASPHARAWVERRAAPYRG